MVGEVGDGEERSGVQSSEGVIIILVVFLLVRVGVVTKVEIIGRRLFKD